MPAAMLPFVTLTGLAVVALLVAESRGSRRGIWIAKPLASLGFIAAGLAAGALDSAHGPAYGRWVLGALVLSMGGDVLLIPKGAPRIFQVGILSFLLGHVAFTAAFAVRGLEPSWLLPAAAWALVPIYVVGRWLRPHVTRELRGAVYAYILVISAMAVCAVGAAAASGDLRIPLGALMFYVSDLSVARDRFVAPSFANRAWGLPLYFAAQLVLASTVA
ncbi:MAG: lysoplasmalogenase [Deltaproteobacteria bacterium]|nr:MAG: lysoplasmalogenase [Deltaproteobacteria bacterium]